MASYKTSSSMDTAARDENSAALLSSGASSGATAALHRNDAGAAHLYCPGTRDATKHDDGGAAYKQHHYSGAPTTKGQDEHDAAYAYAFSGARTAMNLNDGGAADFFPDARTAAPAKNGAPYMFSDVPTAADTKEDYAACHYPSVHADAASQVKNGAPVIFSGVRAAARDEDAKVYLDFNTLAAANNSRGAAAGKGKGNVHFSEMPRVAGFAAGRGDLLPFPTQTRAAAVEHPAAGYYNSGVVAVEALPLASQVFGGKTTSVRAVVAVGHDKVAGRLRRELPVLGLSVASLAVAGLAAGEPTPAAGFGLFLMLIVGLSTVTIRALRD